MMEWMVIRIFQDWIIIIIVLWYSHVDNINCNGMFAYVEMIKSNWLYIYIERERDVGPDSGGGSVRWIPLGVDECFEVHWECDNTDCCGLCQSAESACRP